jgi:molybdopterin adenylyltransferase
LRELSDGFAGLVVTTGGTGFGPRDLTPEGTRAVIERDAPGIVEAIRRASDESGRGFGMLSRAVAGTRGQALLCNLPGSSGGAIEGLEVLLPIAPHALDLLSGGRPH